MMDSFHRVPFRTRAGGRAPSAPHPTPVVRDEFSIRRTRLFIEGASGSSAIVHAHLCQLPVCHPRLPETVRLWESPSRESEFDQIGGNGEIVAQKMRKLGQAPSTRAPVYRRFGFPIANGSPEIS